MPVKPSEKEDEYFAKLEFERYRKIEEEKQHNLKLEEIKRLQKLHYMKCPKCGMQLIEIEYKGIKIDECSSCSGVWLDANELQQVVKLKQSALNKFFALFQ